METRPTNAVPFVPQVPVRAEAAPVRDAVRTDLAPPQAVSAQVGVEQTRWQKAKTDQLSANSEMKDHLVTSDRATGDLVFQVIDPITMEVVAQTPNEQILKLRAYLQAAEHMRAERAAEIRNTEDGHTSSVA